MSKDTADALTDIEKLAEEYGIDTATAEKLAKVLPDALKKAKDQEIEGEKTTSAETELIEKIRTALAAAGIPEESMRKIMESLAMDEADAMEPISVDKKLFEKLKRKFAKEGVSKEIFMKILAPQEPISVDSTPKTDAPMEPISVDRKKYLQKQMKAGGMSPDKIKKAMCWPPEPGTEEQDAPQEPISVDKAFMKKFKEILKRAKLPKDMIIMAMEPISVDTMDSCEIMSDSLDFTLDEKSISITDGILRSHAVCAAAMVQDYSGVKMLKCPDELKLAVQFARMLPITDGHPAGALVRDQKEIKGWTGLLSYNDKDQTIECDIEIFDATLIEKVKSGKHDVSIGFTCEIERKTGEYKRGDSVEKFDAVQRNVVLNHLAAGIEKGRCPSPICGIKSKSDAAPPGPRPGPGPAPGGGGVSPPGGGDPASIGEAEIERALAFYKMSREDWDKLTKTEQLALIERMPAKGQASGYPSPYPAPQKMDEQEKAALIAAEKILADEKARIIDSIMDSKPMKPRSYFDSLNVIVLKGMKDLIDGKKVAGKLGASDSSEESKGAINDAYAGLHGKSPK